jgi:hypothetical protein
VRVQAHDLARTLRRLEPTGWVEAARRFGTGLREAGHEPGRLLVVGTPDEEPWHLTAHLADAARFRAVPALQPVLVRWQVPPGAPAHLSVGLDAVSGAGRGTTVLVSAGSAADAELLERVDDARRRGAGLFALHPGDDELAALVREELHLPPVSGGPLELASHAVTELAAAPAARARRWAVPLRRR